jgi:hypothetical protein
MNSNAERIQSLRVDDLDMTIAHGFQHTGLRGTMVTEKAHNFRLGAKVLASPVVDLGSNDHEFWYWISKADPPYQVYCSYQDLREGKAGRMPIPFQPEWVMEALGLGPYGPADKYTLEHDPQTLKLVEKTTSPQGTPVRKVIVFKRAPVQVPRPQVTDYLLLDEATNKEICAAHISEVQVDKGTGAVIPRRIELRWPAEKLRLDMRLDAAKVNVQTSPETFTRITHPNIKSFNLGRMQVDNSPPPQALSGTAPRPQTTMDSSIQQAQGLAPQTR